MLVSTACCLPARCYLRDSKRWNSLGPMLATGFQLVTVWKAGRVWTTFPWVPALCPVISTCLDPLSIRWLQMICKICSSRQAVSSWLQILGTSVFYARVQALVPQCYMFQCEWWLWGLMCTICCPYPMYTSKSE